MIRSFRGITPKIAASAYVDPGAHVIGDVTVGERSSIWPTAVLRGDIEPIRVGAKTNIQDGSSDPHRSRVSRDRSAIASRWDMPRCCTAAWSKTTA